MRCGVGLPGSTWNFARVAEGAPAILASTDFSSQVSTDGVASTSPYPRFLKS